MRRMLAHTTNRLALPPLGNRLTTLSLVFGLATVSPRSSLTVLPRIRMVIPPHSRAAISRVDASCLAEQPRSRDNGRACVDADPFLHAAERPSLSGAANFCAALSSPQPVHSLFLIKQEIQYTPRYTNQILVHASGRCPRMLDGSCCQESRVSI